MFRWCAPMVLLFAVFIASAAMAGEPSAGGEAPALSTKTGGPEANIENPNQEKGGEKEAAGSKSDWGEVKRVFKRIFKNFTFHGDFLPYYQGANSVDIEGREIDSQHGLNYFANLWITWKPFRNGAFDAWLVAGQGEGADAKLGDYVLAALNQLSSDAPGNDGVDLLTITYTQRFFHDSFFASLGKTHPENWMDVNAFANDQYTQFIGLPFVNDPVLDSEDEYTPLLEIGFSPFKELGLLALASSTTRQLLDAKHHKDSYRDIFDDMFFGGQVTYSPLFHGLQGHYRLLGWVASYGHPKLDGSGEEPGWGVTLNVDQMVHKNVGLFSRISVYNQDVYSTSWFWSFGGQVTGLVPQRQNDNLGLAVAGLKANEDTGNSDFEYHLEGYYRISFLRHFAVTPDIQYVINPAGDSGNDNIFVGTLRGEAWF